MNSGLISLNGVPGSGKTLHAVLIALKHFKNENSPILKFIAFLKYKICKNNIFIRFYSKIKKNKFISKIVNSNLCKSLKNFIFNFPIIGKMLRKFSSIDYEYNKMFPHGKIVNVYSSFPILLDKKRKIYSNMLSLYDLCGDVSFLPDSLLIVDEIQLFADSDEYKDKERNKILSRIAKFLQSHRHFGIKQIIFTSQNPSRIFKKARNIVTWYIKQRKIINIPIIPISIMRGIAYEDFEYYGRYIPKDREERKKLPFDYRKVFKVFNRSKVYSAYDSRYLSLYNYSRPLLGSGLWNGSKVNYEYLCTLFEDAN